MLLSVGCDFERIDRSVCREEQAILSVKQKHLHNQLSIACQANKQLYSAIAKLCWIAREKFTLD
ncbi:MAG: hypothetical protein CL921_02735 [Deltaproteobacteria bacterium]|nr:hypothetical protein [Deltaproteobacteria bacterium]